MSYKYFVTANFGLFFGILIAFKLNFSSEIFILSLAIGFLYFLFYKFSPRLLPIYKLSQSKISLIIICFTFFLSLGILMGQYDIDQDIQKENNFLLMKQNSENFSGRVYKIKKGENSQGVFLEIQFPTQTICDESESRPPQPLQRRGFTPSPISNTCISPSPLERAGVRSKIITKSFPEYRVGDVLSFSHTHSPSHQEGRNPRTENIIWPDPEQNQKSFNLENQNKLEGVSETVLFPVLSQIQNTDLPNTDLKTSFIEKLKNNLDRQSAALTAGVLLGDDSLFSKTDLNNFRIAGLSHIIVLSGFNIIVMIVSFSFLFSFLKLPWRILATIFSIIIFVLFVGPTPSIIRASLMGTILLIANIFGRQYVAKQALFIATFLMMAINPKIAVYDISFHLSFLATVGILYLLPLLPAYSGKNIYLKNIINILKVTIAAQIFVLPYLMYVFGKVSLLGILANILVIPIVPIIMLFGFLVILAPTQTLIILSYITFVFCKYVFLIAEFVASLPGAEIQNYISGFTMFILYLIFIMVILFEEERRGLIRAYPPVPTSPTPPKEGLLPDV